MSLRRLPLLAALLALALAACGDEPPPDPEDETPTAPIDWHQRRKEIRPPKGVDPALVAPHEARGESPPVYRVLLTTGEGEIEVECVREWAPRAADRFYNLVRIGYYDQMVFHMGVEGKMLAFGIHGHQAVVHAWSQAPIADEPSRQSNRRGYLSFWAEDRTNSRSTEVILNLADNSLLDSVTAPFGRVVRGLKVADELRPAHSTFQDVQRMRKVGTGYRVARGKGSVRILEARILTGD